MVDLCFTDLVVAFNEVGPSHIGPPLVGQIKR